VAFDIKVAPTRPTPNLLANPSFESGSGGLPTSWASGAFQSSAVFGLASGIAKSGTHSASIAAATPNDAMWSQSVSGLTPGHGYALCGWLKGRNVATTPAAGVGANVSVVGGFVLSQGRSGTFDWAESCVMFKAEATSSQVACRLGFYGSTVTGKVWCDDMLLTPLRSAF
jgi:hypothetical protein